MASLETIRRITIEAKTDGVDPATASLNKLAAAQDNVSVVSEKSSKSTLSVQSALDRQQRSLDSTYRSQQQFAQAESVLSRARDQGLITAERHNQLLDLAATKYGQASAASRAFGTITGSVTGQLVALSAGFGPVGVALAAFGPWGLAAAAAIGLVSNTWSGLVEGALKAGQSAVELNKFAVATGLTVEQISALKRAAAQFNVDGDEVATRIERFTTQLHNLQEASGPLYDVIRKVNPVIAEQITRTRDAASAFELYAQAERQASLANKTLMDNTAFGRGGVAFGAVVGSIADQGGLQAMIDKTRDLNIVTQTQNTEWVRLTTQINEANKQAEKIKQSIYTGVVLREQLAIAEAGLAWAKGLRAAADEAERISKLPFWDRIKSLLDPSNRDDQAWRNAVGGAAAGAVPGASAGNLVSAGTGADRGRLGLPTSADQTIIKDILKDVRDLTSLMDSPSAASNKYNAFIAALHGTATPAERLQQQLLALNKSLEENAVTAERAARVSGILQESFKVDRLRTMVSALGAAATPTEQLNATIGALHLQLAKGEIGWDTYRRSLVNAADTYRLTNTAARERLGILTDEELRTNAAKDINDAWAKGFIKNSSDAAIAQQVLAKSIQDTSERMQVLRSPLPGLTQLGLDAGNLGKQLDSVSTTSLNNITTALVDMTTGTHTAADAFRNLAQQVVRSLEEMVIKMLIVAPVARSLQAALGGLGLGGFNPNPYGDPSWNVPVGHSGGMVGSLGASRYIHPAYFDDAPRFRSGGIVGGEVPVIAHRGEGIFTPGQMAAMGGGNITMHAPITVNLPAGATKTDEAQAALVADAIEARLRGTIRDEMAQQMRQGGILKR